MNKDSRLDVLGKVKVSKAIMIQALPATIGLVVSALYITVDSMFVSWLGTDYASASQVVYPLITVISAMGFIFGTGGGSFVARLLGMGDHKKANRTASVSITLAVIMGIIPLLAIVFMPQIVTIFGAHNEEVKNLAITYGRILMIGQVFQIVNVCFNNLLRSEGSVKFSMQSMIIASVINLILDPIFIFGFGWGIAGAALATIISQIINFILLARVYSSKKSIAVFSFKEIVFEKAVLSEILKIGIPTFLKSALMSAATVVLNNLVIEISGSDGLAAVGNVTRTLSILVFIVFGYGQGYQPICGYSYGSNNIKRVLEATKVALKVSTLFCVISGLFLIFFGQYVLLIFRPTEEVLDFATNYIRFQGMSFMLLGIMNTISIYFMAIGNAKISGLLSIARQGLFFFPVAYLVPLLLNNSQFSIYIIQPIADVFTLLVSILFFIPEYSKLKKRLKNKVEEAI